MSGCEGSGLLVQSLTKSEIGGCTSRPRLQPTDRRHRCPTHHRITNEPTTAAAYSDNESSLRAQTHAACTQLSGAASSAIALSCPHLQPTDHRRHCPTRLITNAPATTAAYSDNKSSLGAQARTAHTQLSGAASSVIGLSAEQQLGFPFAIQTPATMTT
jgi:hypothetical protein